MKNIAVLVYSLTVEYSLNILEGIADFYKDKDVRLLVGQTKHPHCPVGLHEYQNWTNTSFLNSDSIDAIITISGPFSSATGQTDISAYFQQYSNKPIISISIPLDLPDSIYTKVASKGSYCEIVKHLKEVHNCKKIAFFSGNLTKSEESFERFDDYKAALKENNLPYDEELVFHGALISSFAEKYCRTKFKSKSDITFDAIICANDLTAIGCITVFKELGLRIPEDIKIVGFDNTSHAILSNPPLTTIDQNLFEQGTVGAKLIYDKLNGKKIPKENLYIPKVIYRESCGCNYNEDQHEIEKYQYTVQNNRKDSNYLNGIDRAYSLFDMVTSATTLKKVFYSLRYLMSVATIDTCAVCFYEKPITLEQKDDFILPSKMILEMYVDLENNLEIFEPGITFNPKETLFPEKTFHNQAGNYMIQPIFSGKQNYGYLLFTVQNPTFANYNLIQKIIVNAISQAYEYTTAVSTNQKLSDENKLLQQNNSDLNIQSKTDELTKILNRRGFLELGQKAIDIALEIGSSGLVFFVDMDNLKIINDTYGHKTGDRAIKALSTVLTKTLRANDIVGRIGGDEFAIVASGLTLPQVEKIRKKIEILCKEISEEKSFSFTLSCSLGAVEFTQKPSKLEDLLKKADKLLYKEKQIKHAKNK